MFILNELDKHKMEQARYEDASYNSSSSQSTYYSSSSQGDSQFGSQPPPEYNAYNSNNMYTKPSHDSNSSSSPHSEGTKAAYHETIMLQLKRTFCQSWSTHMACKQELIKHDILFACNMDFTS